MFWKKSRNRYKSSDSRPSTKNLFWLTFLRPRPNFRHSFITYIPPSYKNKRAKEITIPGPICVFVSECFSFNNFVSTFNNVIRCRSFVTYVTYFPYNATLHLPYLISLSRSLWPGNNHVYFSMYFYQVTSVEMMIIFMWRYDIQIYLICFATVINLRHLLHKAQTDTQTKLDSLSIDNF